MGKVITSIINGMEKYPDCIEEARMNERDMKTDIRTSWKSKFQLLGGYPPKSVEVVPAVKS